MILPIRVYGDPVLRQQTQDVTADSPELQQLIDDLLATMRNASGSGLAAPQVGRPERVFVADLTSVLRHPEAGTANPVPPQPMVCLNPRIVWESDEDAEFEEGCLSIPGLSEVVVRAAAVRMRYLDRQFAEQEVEVSGALASVLQHEYDHLEGVLYIDHLSAFRRGLLRRRLKEMAKGQVEAKYPLAVARP